MKKVNGQGDYFRIKEPKWSWEEIGGLTDAKERLREMVSLPLKLPDIFAKVELKPPSGIFLWGPPGGGKTILSEAAAKSADASYITVKAIEIISEPEEIERMYDTALELAPTVVFINEIDALAPNRKQQLPWSISHTRDAPLRLAPTETTKILYEQLDRMSSRKDVITIGGTYRPDVVDPQLLRKGRLEKKIYVPAPDYEGRIEIFRIHLKGTPLSKDVSLEDLAEKTEFYVGADIEGVVREAKIIAIREKGEEFDSLEARHFEEALRRIPPYLSPEIMKKYNETYEAECDHCYLF
jgi:transitional endoplasmic reticulum ATPase